MTKREAARAYRKIAKELERLHGAAANHISRMDNNWQFEAMWSCKHIAERIEDGYNHFKYERGGGGHIDIRNKTSDHS